MKKLAVWIMACALLLAAIYGLAESKLPSATSTEEKQTFQAEDQEEAALAPESVQYPPLQKGDSGDGVKALQSRLTELQYYFGKISGNYLDGTSSAIASFQSKNGLEVTGAADSQTQELLFDTEKALAKNAITQPSITPAPSAAPTPTPPPVSASESVDAEGTPAPDVTHPPYTKQLKKGSTGDSVALLHQRLWELGYLPEPDGATYTQETKDAVAAFQQNNSLTSDGVTGKKTWNMLFENEEVLDASATPRPTPVPTPVPYALTVDITNQVITAYGLDENGQYTNVARQMICSTGAWATPTGLGTFTLGAGRSRFPLFPKYGCYVQYWTPIANGFGFHSVIYNTKNTMDLAVGSYSALGTRVSHGCIRLLVDDAKWIYENAGKGTVVTITNKIASDPELTQSLKPAPLNWKNMLPKATPAPTPPPQNDSASQPPTPFRNLSRGKKGEDVYWLQMKLKEMGYYAGTVTGGYYGGTQKAVKAFQKDSGLTADGVAGTKTQTVLYQEVLPTATPAPSPASIPTPAPAP